MKRSFLREVGLKNDELKRAERVDVRGLAGDWHRGRMNFSAQQQLFFFEKSPFCLRLCFTYETPTLALVLCANKRRKP